jgi:FKBP-type peptidyl-prolyl cis-trans isomerase
MFRQHRYYSQVNQKIMNLFNKYEAIGILMSVGVMAIALASVRFQTDDLFSKTLEDQSTQSAVVAVSQENNKDIALEQRLKSASTAEGKLTELVIDDVALGTGDEVQTGSVVTVHYIGTTQDGVRFDSSYDRGEPFIFTVGEGKVIKGWDVGLLGMKVGGKRILVIPSEMAYGNRKVGPIPPNAPLVFSIELLEIK